MVAGPALTAYIIVIILILAFGLALYFIPTIVAFFNRHPQRFGILILNLLLGWTFVGWIGALIWAVVDLPGSPLRAGGLSVAGPAVDMKVCPRCAESIKRAALVCRFCGQEFSPGPPPPPPPLSL